MSSREGADGRGDDTAYWASMQHGIDVGAVEERVAQEGRAAIEARRFAKAASDAAQALDVSASGWVLENSLEQELLASLARQLDGAVWEPRRRVEIPTWTPGLGAIDLVGYHGEGLAAVAELKIESVDESLWDILKIVDFAIPPVVALVAVVASTSRWEEPNTPAELFADSADRWMPHSTDQLFRRYADAWAHCTGPRGSKPRPISLPERIEIKTEKILTLDRVPRQQLRVIQVRPVDPDSRMTPDNGFG